MPDKDLFLTPNELNEPKNVGKYLLKLLGKNGTYIEYT